MMLLICFVAAGALADAGRSEFLPSWRCGAIGAWRARVILLRYQSPQSMYRMKIFMTTGQVL